MKKDVYIAKFGIDRAEDSEASVLGRKRRSTFWDDYVAPALLVGAVMFLVGLWCGMTIVQMGLGV